ncbi:MAG: glycosyltransferase [Gemmataceae bacterium]|nr:glycosyltransferase [Gemmata sp.]MDW8196529.1 glycosyltransferase [Gemmataceae bacterium]
MKPVVSVVMAAKNYARFLPEAVTSVSAQTFTAWELLIIDDGSTDHTAEAVQPFLADRRLRYLRSDTLGQARAKNLGVRLSRGQFIAFLDADDAWEPTKLEKQLALLAAQPAVGVVFCGRSLMDEASRPLPRQPMDDPPRGFVLPQLITQNFVCFSSCVVKREVFARVGAFDPQWDLAIDYDFWLRVAQFYAFEYVAEPLVRYRTGHGNLSKKLRDRVDTALAILHRAETRYGLRAVVPSPILAAGYASTCQTLGYTLRASEPVAALQWYTRALRWPALRYRSVKGIVASLWAVIRGQRTAAWPENATVNL